MYSLEPSHLCITEALHDSSCQVVSEANVMLKQTSFEGSLTVEGMPAKKKLKVASALFVCITPATNSSAACGATIL